MNDVYNQPSRKRFQFKAQHNLKKKGYFLTLQRLLKGGKL